MVLKCNNLLRYIEGNIPVCRVRKVKVAEIHTSQDVNSTKCCWEGDIKLLRPYVRTVLDGVPKKIRTKRRME